MHVSVFRTARDRVESRPKTRVFRPTGRETCVLGKTARGPGTENSISVFSEPSPPPPSTTTSRRYRTYNTNVPCLYTRVGPVDFHEPFPGLNSPGTRRDVSPRRYVVATLSFRYDTRECLCKHARPPHLCAHTHENAKPVSFVSAQRPAVQTTR